MRPAVPPFIRPKKLVLHRARVCERVCRHLKSGPAMFGCTGWEGCGKLTHIRAISHVLIKVQAKPSVEMKRKFLYAGSRSASPRPVPLYSSCAPAVAGADSPAAPGPSPACACRARRCWSRRGTTGSASPGHRRGRTRRSPRRCRACWGRRWALWSARGGARCRPARWETE